MSISVPYVARLLALCSLFGLATTQDTTTGAFAHFSEDLVLHNALRLSLEWFYIKHNPEKLDTLPRVLHHFRDREDKLIESLEKKYKDGVTIADAKAALLARAAHTKERGNWTTCEALQTAAQAHTYKVGKFV